MDTTDWETWLGLFLERHGASNGTVHTIADDSRLTLRAAKNIPPPVLNIVQHIPRGKGMAGLAWERNAPVSTCDLKTDATGDVRPGARAVDAKAAVALPVHDAAGNVRAVVGLAFAFERDLTEDELARLSSEAEQLPV